MGSRVHLQDGVFEPLRLGSRLCALIKVTGHVPLRDPHYFSLTSTLAVHLLSSQCWGQVDPPEPNRDHMRHPCSMCLPVQPFAPLCLAVPPCAALCLLACASEPDKLCPLQTWHGKC